MNPRLLVVAAALAILAAIDLAPAAGVARAAVSTSRPIRIITAPPEPHLRLALAGRVYTTDERGHTTIPTADLQRLPRRLLAGRLLELVGHIRPLPDPRPNGSRFRIERWYPRPRAPGLTLAAGVDRFRPVRLTFVSRTGRPVPPALIDSVQIRRFDGAVINLTGDQLPRPIMLQANRVARIRHALVPKPLLHRIQRVSVGGSNLVNRAQQSFLPGETGRVTVRLLFYAVRFQARDTLFGFPIGSGVRLVYPDGKVRVHRFQGKGEVAIAGLPRGSYRVDVMAPGLSPSTPVSITRDHMTRIEVLSYLDIAVLVLGFVGLLVGLVLLRRRALRERLSPLRRLQRRRGLRRSG
jgi:hypothetical protein